MKSGNVGARKAVEKLGKALWKKIRVEAGFARRREVFLSTRVEGKSNREKGFTGFSSVCTETTTTVFT
jgi:hypothetical protein